MITEKDVLDAIRKDEHETSEFKSNFIKNGELAEDIMSFAHKNGGIIYLGIDQKTKQLSGKIKSITQNHFNRINCAACNCLVPEVSGVTAQEVLIHGKKVLAIEVPKSNRIHQHTNGKILIRRGSENVAFTGKALEQAIERSREFENTYDSHPLLSASLAHIDYMLVTAYAKNVLSRNPNSKIVTQPVNDIIKSVGAVEDHEGILHPTPAGLAFFCTNPQFLLPQSSITFLHFSGTDISSGDGRGGPYLDNREMSGTLPDIIEETHDLILGSMKRRSVMSGFRREEIPEYPSWAIREAIVNAVAHRDYSITGSKTQVRMFSDRIEVQSPGGLPGHITVENIEKEQFTRNQRIMGLLEDLGFVEERGIGVDNMISAMREAGLEPPIFKDTGASVTVILRNATLLDDETIEWLNQFANIPLSQEQRMALAYLQRNPNITNRIYQRINNVSSVKATRSFSELVLYGLVKQHGTRGGAYYTLIRDDIERHVESYLSAVPRVSKEEVRQILNYVIQKDQITNLECRELLGTNQARAHYLLKLLVDNKILRPVGEFKNRYYILHESIQQLSK